MKRSFRAPLLTAAVVAVFGVNAFAQDISVIGAEKTGNAARTIPAWDGGHTSMNGSQPGGPYADPYAADQPLFTITAADAEKYRTSLTAGQLEMLKKYPSYKMNVYPTRRSAPLAKCVAAETAANKGKAKLTADAKGINGAIGGVLFPNTKDGTEAVWNALTRYRGDVYSARWSQIAVNPDGKTGTLGKFEVEYDFHYGACGKSAGDREPNRVLNYIQRTTEPARTAGTILLVQETLDQTRDARSAWTYNPGQRRVRLAPEVSYDNPGFGAEGLRTADDLSLFNGAPDRYRWKFLGKREIYIPYNNHKAIAANVSIETLTDGGHLNPELVRHELHRVYVIEGDLRSGESHLYHKRTLYIDEDSWMIVASDKYDRSGALWRYAEMYSIPAPDLGFVYPAMDAHYDFQSKRYLVSGIRSGESKLAVPQKRTAADYTPARLRGEGTR
jgi:hypothetical protein